MRYSEYWKIPLPIKMPKLEFECGVGSWNVKSSVQTPSASGNRAEHTSVFKLSRGNEDLISVEAAHAVEGTPNHNFGIASKSTGKKTLVLYIVFQQC